MSASSSRASSAGEAPGLSGGRPGGQRRLPAGRAVTIVALGRTGPGHRPRHGLRYRQAGHTDYPGRESWDVIGGMREGDDVVGAVALRDGSRTSCSSRATPSCFASRPPPCVRRAGGRRHGRDPPVSRGTGGFFGAVDPVGGTRRHVGRLGHALPGTQPGSLKVTPYAEYPTKGRGTGGVRAHRFLRGEDTLVLAWVAPSGRALRGERCPPSTSPSRPGGATGRACPTPRSSPASGRGPIDGRRGRRVTDRYAGASDRCAGV